MALRGIDVSTNNGVIDWRKAAKAVDFAIIKATQGRGAGPSTALLRKFTDSKFKYNITNAMANKLTIGVYHYLNCSTIEEAEEEAAYFCKIIAPYRPYIKIFAAVDVEDGAYSQYAYLPKDKLQLTEVVNAFTERVRRGGFTPAIYTNRAFLTYRLNFGELKCKTIWRAHWYNRADETTTFEEWGSADAPTDYAQDMPVWQFGKGDKGYIDGIKSEIDINYGYLDIATSEPDYAALVCEKCGLEAQTRDYLDRYVYADDLWRKLWKSME
mgnify:FL=1